MRHEIAVARQAFRARVTRVVDDFVTFADYIMGAVTFGTAATLVTVAVLLAGIVAVEEVGADAARAASRVTFEVVVAGIFRDFLPMQTLGWVHARVVRAAVSSVDAIVIEVAKDLLHDRVDGLLPLVALLSPRVLLHVL